MFLLGDRLFGHIKVCFMVVNRDTVMQYYYPPDPSTLFNNQYALRKQICPYVIASKELYCHGQSSMKRGSLWTWKDALRDITSLH